MNVKTINREQKLSPEILEQLTEEELRDLKLLFDSDIANIATQLEDATAEAQHSPGRYEDCAWFRKATQAKRFKGISTQQIQNELARRRGERRKQQMFTDELLRAIGIVVPDRKEEIVAIAKSRIAAEA